MEPPPIVAIAAWSQLLPVIVGLTRAGRLTRVHWGLLAWLSVMALHDLLNWLWAIHWKLGNNLWTFYSFQPLEVTIIMWALAEWQGAPLARRIVRASIPVLLAWLVVVILFFEDHTNFPMLGAPVFGFAGLIATLSALVTRAQRATEPMLTEDWTWILGGLAVFFGFHSSMLLLSAIATTAQDWPLLIRTINVKCTLDTLAMIIIAGGFACLSPRPPSGASSSLPRSPSPSSSASSS